MAAICNRAGHYIFALWFLSFFLFLSFPRLISAVGDWMSTILPHMLWPLCEFRMQVWNVLHVARWKYRTQKSQFWHHRTTLSACIFADEARIDNRKKNLLNIDTSSTCFHKMVNFVLLTAEICWRVWGTPAHFNWFLVLAALIHGTPVFGVSQTLRRWTEGVTDIRQGGHHVGHWPTFLVIACNALQFLHAIIAGVQTCWKIFIWGKSVAANDSVWWNHVT